MKKILLSLLVLTFLSGCVAKDEPKETVEEKVLTDEDYYNIAVETLDSDQIGNIVGQSIAGVIPGGAYDTNYTGTVSNGSVKLQGTTASIGSSDFALESDIRNYTQELDDVTQGITFAYSLYDGSIDGMTCDLEKRVLTCNSTMITESAIEGDNMTPSNTKYDGVKYSFIFTFDKNDKLEKIDIAYAHAMDMIQSSEGDTLISEEISNFLENPEMKFFAYKPIFGKMYFGNETIEYTN